jgi:hypothetical protein
MARASSFVISLRTQPRSAIVLKSAVRRPEGNQAGSRTTRLRRGCVRQLTNDKRRLRQIHKVQRKNQMIPSDDLTAQRTHLTAFVSKEKGMPLLRQVRRQNMGQL